MKHLRLLFTSSLLMVSATGAGRFDYIVDDIAIEPFNLEKRGSTIRFHVNANKLVDVNVKIYIINSNFRGEHLYFEETYTSKEDVNVVYDNLDTAIKNNYVKIEWDCPKRNVHDYVQHSADISPGGDYNLEENEYRYISHAKCFRYLEDSGWTAHEQELEFSNFFDAYVPNFYHKIDPTEFKIESISGYTGDLIDRNSFFTISNLNGAFDSLNHDENNAILPIKIVSDNNYKTFHLEFSEDLFVNTQTLEMSLTRKPGFIKTQYLYLPINGKKYEKEYQCSISLNNFGYDDLNTVVNFKYVSVLNIIGDCHNSEYCIIQTQ